jgi:hypothetical protein
MHRALTGLGRRPAQSPDPKDMPITGMSELNYCTGGKPQPGQHPAPGGNSHGQ